jgi:phenylalanine-4-hydroxylase
MQDICPAHADRSSHAASAAFITQDWHAYRSDQHLVWSLLYERRMQELAACGASSFLEGMKTAGLSATIVPNLVTVNARLSALTGWQAVPVSGFLEPRAFFACLAERRFPTTISVRPIEQLDYLPEPDIFHDVFGHIPMHADPVFADFLQAFGRVAASCRTEKQRTQLTRLFWFTVEFGLIEEGGAIKVYGSGLISSAADCANALSDKCDHRPFSLDAVYAQDFAIDDLQPALFVVRSFDELFAAVSEAERRLGDE